MNDQFTTKQSISDVIYDFEITVDQLRLTEEERKSLLGYMSYLSEIAEELNDKLRIKEC